MRKKEFSIEAARRQGTKVGTVRFFCFFVLRGWGGHTSGVQLVKTGPNGYSHGEKRNDKWGGSTVPGRRPSTKQGLQSRQSKSCAIDGGKKRTEGKIKGWLGGALGGRDAGVIGKQGLIKKKGFEKGVKEKNSIHRREETGREESLREAAREGNKSCRREIGLENNQKLCVGDDVTRGRG